MNKEFNTFMAQLRGFNSQRELDTTEITNLHNALMALDVPHEFITHEIGNGKHLYYPNKEDVICSAVTFLGSYGDRNGLIEIMGLLTEDEQACDDVVGYLTATEVCRRILEHWNSIQE